MYGKRRYYKTDSIMQVFPGRGGDSGAHNVKITGYNDEGIILGTYANEYIIKYKDIEKNQTGICLTEIEFNKF